MVWLAPSCSIRAAMCRPPCGLSIRTTTGVASPIALGGGSNTSVECVDIMRRITAGTATKISARIRSTERILDNLFAMVASFQSVRHGVDHIVHADANRHAG